MLHTPACDPPNMRTTRRKTQSAEVHTVFPSANPDSGLPCSRGTVACHKISSPVNSEDESDPMTRRRSEKRKQL
jgi:hypothetical protein